MTGRPRAKMDLDSMAARNVGILLVRWKALVEKLRGAPSRDISYFCDFPANFAALVFFVIAAYDWEAESKNGPGLSGRSKCWDFIGALESPYRKTKGRTISRF